MRQFSPPHLAALAVMVVLVVGSVVAARRWPGRWMRWWAWLLAAGIFVAWAGEYVDDVVLGIWSVQFTLPLQLTDVISLLSIYALLTRRAWAVQVLFLWAFTATLQAVLTPDLAHNFPTILYFTYFGYHVGAIVAAAFLAFGQRVYPEPRFVWVTWGATLSWAAVAGLADVITGGNYMYLAWKPAHGSLLSYLGPWPWYIAGAAAVGLAMLWLVEGVAVGLRRWLGDAERGRLESRSRVVA